MFNTELAKKKFLWLSQPEKVIKMKSILTIIKHALPMYEDIDLQLTALGEKAPVELLDMYYTMIMKNLENLQWDSLESFTKELKNFKLSLKKDLGEKMDKKELENIEQALQDLDM